MRFTEIDLFGVIRCAVLVDDGGSVADHGRTAPMARISACCDTSGTRPRFVLRVYTIVLSSMVLLAAR